MPPSRRKSAGPAVTGAQSTLSFGAHSRVTKSTVHQSKKAKDPSLLGHAVTKATSPCVEEVVETTPTAEKAVLEQAEVEVQKIARTREEEEADKVGEGQLRRYWDEREAERKAPRVHQEDLNMHEKILRHFDLSSQYGPCIGVARMKRWNRAYKLNLHPPIEVLAVLLRDRATGDTKTERAYVDELMSSRYDVE